MKISTKYLESLGADCEGFDWYKENFGDDEYTIDELIETAKNKYLKPDPDTVCWLICSCKDAQTEKMLNYFIGLDPPCSMVSCVIACCTLVQTQEMLDYYLSLKPSAFDVNWLMRRCGFARRNKKLQKYFKGLKPPC